MLVFRCTGAQFRGHSGGASSGTLVQLLVSHMLGEPDLVLAHRLHARAVSRTAAAALDEVSTRM